MLPLPVLPLPVLLLILQRCCCWCLFPPILCFGADAVVA